MCFIRHKNQIISNAQLLLTQTNIPRPVFYFQFICILPQEVSYAKLDVSLLPNICLLALVKNINAQG